MSVAPVKEPARRLASLDQFRGYTVAGMFLVNFCGGFAVIETIYPVLKHHNDYCSYADTIMPQFLFAVGFAFRLTFGRRAKLDGTVAAYGHVVKRLLGLAVVAFVMYGVGIRAENWDKLSHMNFWVNSDGSHANTIFYGAVKRDWFQTLMHIAATSLWILPVIRANGAVRVAYMLVSAALHVYLSYRFYFVWCNTDPNVIDGGPLGFLSWSIPAIMGTLACDAVMAPGGARIASMATWAFLLMGIGYLFSCGTRFYDVPPSQVESLRSQKLAANPVIPSKEQTSEEGAWRWPFAELPLSPPPGQDYRKWNYWMMSQRAGTLSYLTFSAGFSLAVYILFYVVCDVYGWQLGFFRTLGVNALAGYMLHGMVSRSVRPFMPKDIPQLYMWCGIAFYFLIIYLILRSLEKNKIYIKL